jgi:predicted dehydrogenase
MNKPLTRRRFFEYSALTGGLAMAGCASTPVPAPRVTGRLRHAAVAVGGMGKADLEHFASHPEVDIVALCDVDAVMLEKAHKLYPDAKTFRDWREMFASSAHLFDSVTICTPDHMHAQIAMEAMASGKHVYCQKPLTRTVFEARSLSKAAARSGVVTQMGIQNHTDARLTTCKAIFDEGHIGEVYAVHVWTDRPNNWWPQGVGRPEGSDPVPEELDWDKWLGVAPVRPYKQGQYHPFNWRGWKDFGTGAQGDMGCHLMDPAIWFLGLGHPTSIRSDGPAPSSETYPLYSRVEYEFPPTEMTTKGPLKFTWHDGGKRVYKEILETQGFYELQSVKDRIQSNEEITKRNEEKLKLEGKDAKLERTTDPLYSNGCLFLGTRGAFLATPYDPPLLMGHENSEKIQITKLEGTNHRHEFIDACLGKGETSAPFSYSAQMTEIVLLGNIALHFPHEKLIWEGEKMRFKQHAAATQLVSPTYREDWT